ncbi:MAG: N-acetyltransferase [Chitinophagaceae bacterium]|nr:N-acetyltransferase [Chitinophagaceae bacterium]
MQIQHKKLDKQGVFYIEEDGNLLAEMTYSDASPGKIIIEHTEVDEKLRGKNIGYELVHTAVEYARENNFKIVPLCVFAKAVFDKKAEFQDVLA